MSQTISTPNPRYVAYAKAYGRTADEQMAHDYEAWPGGVMCGFILWASERRRAFFSAHPEAFGSDWRGQRSAHMMFDLDAWDAFLGVAKGGQS